MSSESSEREQSPSPAKSPRSSPIYTEETQVVTSSVATIARPPHTGAPPPPLRPTMTPWLGEAPASFAPGASWQQQLNTFQPWLSSEADKHPSAAPGFSGLTSQPQHPGSAFQRPGHGPRQFLAGGQRQAQAGFDRPLGAPPRPPTHLERFATSTPTQIFRQQPDPGEVTIEKVEHPWAVTSSSASAATSAGPSRAPPPVSATSSSLR